LAKFNKLIEPHKVSCCRPFSFKGQHFKNDSLFY